MKILVTGGTGLVGKAVQSIESEFDHDMVYVNSKDCDLTDYESTFRLIKETTPDCVVHLAAYVGGLYKNMNFKVDMLENNLLMNHNILKSCFMNDVPRFLGTLSTCIFPDKTTYPINENMLHDGPPHNSNDAYAYAKRMLDTHCRAYNEQHNTNYSCFIPSNIYGEYDNFSLEDAHVIPALIHKCYLAKKAGVDFEVRGTGKPLRQFIYSKDLARAILSLAPKLNQENVIVVGSDQEITIKRAATAVAKSFDYIHRMRFNPQYSDGQFKKTADNSKLMKLLPDFKCTDIDTGIKNSVRFFEENYPKIRI